MNQSRLRVSSINRNNKIGTKNWCGMFDRSKLNPFVSKSS